MKLNITLIFLAVSINALAQQTFLWCRQGGGPGFDRVDGTVTSGKDIFITGGFTGKFSMGGEEISGKGMRDIFVARLNENGEPAWIHPLGGKNPDYATCIAATDKNIYVAGTTADSVWSEKTVSYETGQTLFVSSWQQNGKLAWISRIGYKGTALFDVLKITPSGNLLAGGTFIGTIIVDGKETASYGGSKAFLMEISPEGKIISNLISSGTGNHRLASLDTDPDGNRYLLFHATGSFSFSGSGLANGAVMEKGGIIVIKTDQEGKILWLKNAEGTGYTEATSICTDKGGEVYVIACFNDRLNTGERFLSTTARLASAFLCYGSDGVLKWTALTETIDMCRIMDALCTDNGTLLATGQYQGNFRLGETIFPASMPGGSVFLLQLSPAGTVTWHDEPTVAGATFSKSLAVDPAGNTFLAGAFSGKIIIDNTELVSAGEDDILVAKYFNCRQTDLHTELILPLCPGGTGILQATSGYEIYLWNNSIRTGKNLEIQSPGRYTVIATDRQGCSARDSIDVKTVSVPPLDLGTDAALSPGNSLVLAAPPGFTSYTWSDGISGAGRTINYKTNAQPEIFRIVAKTAEGCKASDSIKVTYLPEKPGVDFPGHYGLAAYPNPVQDILSWSARLPAIQDVVIRLVDSRSAIVFSGEIKNYLPGSEGSISMVNLPPGNYLLTLRARGTVMNQNVVKK